jgi:hypothetical protein
MTTNERNEIPGDIFPAHHTTFAIQRLSEEHDEENDEDDDGEYDDAA